jgi:uroporphyrin-III C-methyltransferase/precorrin-2 dehydrogenase/sirohydrochlorin ferrochelatase
MSAVLGFVSLVGAGPGDPDHLTQKAVRRLREADLVLYDALVSHEVLALASHAEHVFVGKRAGRVQTSQRAIEELLVISARSGRRVVRLKGGDPFVFGRGAEEAFALEAARIPFEVVPGVTSAVSAPALAGIPVTCRGLSSAFVVVAGSDVAKNGHVIDGLRPGSITIVAMMAASRRDELVQRLMAHGWPPDTPAALILGASTPSMWTWRGGLSDLPGAIAPAASADAPGTIVIGAVAALAIGSAAIGPHPETTSAPSGGEERSHDRERNPYVPT